MVKINLNFFEHETNVKAYAAGDTVFSEGDPGGLMYGIQSGTIEVIYKGKVIQTLSDGDVFGEMAIIDNSPRSAAVVARTDCKLVEINNRDFLHRIQHHPTFALFVMQTITERLREKMQQL